MSRAHRGVLFLDECAEIGTKVLESLRTPLEDGEVRIARRDGVARYPARFQLVLAANPCPCAPARDLDCVCAPTARRRYLGKLSGPLMDRVDLRVVMQAPTTGTYDAEVGESSEVVRERVSAARSSAALRWHQHGCLTNNEVPGHLLRREFRLPRTTIRPLEDALRRGRVTSRGADRALRVAWTVCDLRGGELPDADDVTTALVFKERALR